MGTSHLNLIWVRGFETIMFKPHILKHHIPEHPNCADASLLMATEEVVHACNSARVSTHVCACAYVRLDARNAMHAERGGRERERERERESEREIA